MLVGASAWALLGCCCFASCGVTFVLVLAHARSWAQPLVQRKIVSILWMVPIYAFEAWLSLRFTEAAPLLDMARDCYEAYVVYVFFALCMAYLGGGGADQSAVDMTKVHLALQQQGSVCHPPPFDRCFYPVKLVTGSERFILRCKTCILQFVLLKPLCTLAALLLSLAGRYREGEIDLTQGYVYVAFVDNISVTISLYYLALFYMATKTALAPHRPLAKFVCIKCVVFFTWWQSLVLSLVCRVGALHSSDVADHAHTCSELTTTIQNVVIQFEVLALALVHLRVFSAAHFRFGLAPPARQPLANLMPVDRQSLSEDLREVGPGGLPQVLSGRPAVSEQRAYMPPATDPSPVVPTSDAEARGAISQVELPPNPASMVASAGVENAGRPS